MYSLWFSEGGTSPKLADSERHPDISFFFFVVLRSVNVFPSTIWALVSDSRPGDARFRAGSVVHAEEDRSRGRPHPNECPALQWH